MKRHGPLRVISAAALALSASSLRAAEAVDPPAPVVVSAGDDLEQARACWQRLVTVDLSAARHAKLARPAIDRLLATAQGRTLITELCGLSAGAEHEALRSTIEVRLVDHLPHSRDGTDGCFRPARPGANRYQVFVRAEYVGAAAEPTVFVFGEYPGNPNCSVVFFYQEAASAMAQTLYHELLHVWFVNAFAHQHRRYPTGHGMVSRCEFEEEFFDRLSAHAAELAELEGRAPKPLIRVRVPHSPGPY